ncbi:hypothetical protein KI387_016848, partial [Taxus chinensis]
MISSVKPKLLRHPDKEVRLVVITCLSEITRITTPKFSSSSKTMRKILQLIVESFQGLDDIKSPFARRVTILETMEKVRSCVVMLDLECNDLILKMFQHFLVTVSKNHAEHAVASMQTIMTLILNESDDISQNLLSTLLASLEQEVSLVAHTLAKNVVDQCAKKLKPYVTIEGLTSSDQQKKSFIVMREEERSESKEKAKEEIRKHEEQSNSKPQDIIEQEQKGPHMQVEGEGSSIEKGMTSDKQNVCINDVKEEHSLHVECEVSKIEVVSAQEEPINLPSIAKFESLPYE